MEPPLPTPQPQVRTRSGHVTAAAVLLIAMGVLVALFGVLFVLVGTMFPTLRQMPELADQLGSLPPSFGGFIAVVGLLALAHGILQVASGIFILPGRAWARITGLMLATLGALLGLIGVLPGEGSTPGGIAFSLALMGAYVYVALVLIRNAGWFAARR